MENARGGVGEKRAAAQLRKMTGRATNGGGMQRVKSRFAVGDILGDQRQVWRQWPWQQ